MRPTRLSRAVHERQHDVNTIHTKQCNQHSIGGSVVECSPATRAARHRWFSGRMLACHAGGPGSIPGRCNFFIA
ncbi:hypothetical protein B566_EDAN010443 [Ephemera danica]|nr:hypothetical protein B566_EDAN010443 [Ephemera danica]